MRWRIETSGAAKSERTLGEGRRSVRAGFAQVWKSKKPSALAKCQTGHLGARKDTHVHGTHEHERVQERTLNRAPTPPRARMRTRKRESMRDAASESERGNLLQTELLGTIALLNPSCQRALALPSEARASPPVQGTHVEPRGRVEREEREVLGRRGHPSKGESKHTHTRAHAHLTASRRRVSKVLPACTTACTCKGAAWQTPPSM